MHASGASSVALARESFDLPLDRLVDEMRVLRIIGTALPSVYADSSNASWHWLTLVNAGLLHLLTATEMRRLSELLTLIELVEVWSVLVDRLRAFLVLSGVIPDAHVGASDRVAPRMELLDALRQVRILRISGQHCGLIQMLAAVLHPMDLHAYLNSGLLEV